MNSVVRLPITPPCEYFIFIIKFIFNLKYTIEYFWQMIFCNFFDIFYLYSWRGELNP